MDGVAEQNGAFADASEQRTDSVTDRSPAAVPGSQKQRAGYSWDSDSFATPKRILALLDLCEPEGLTLDPFGARHALVRAATIFHINDGDDAYALSWDVEAFNRIYANGPFSGDHPERTAQTIAKQIARSRSMVVYNMTLASPGSAYWKAHVWPSAAAIAWLGRVPFIAPPGHEHAGKELRGNRNEMALVLSGTADAVDVRRFARVFATVGGYPVSLVGAA